MRHMSLQQLSALRDAALAGVSLEIVRKHVSECEECRSRHARLERVDGLLVHLISHDPGVVWFEDASGEIGRLLRGENDGRAMAPIRAGGTPPTIEEMAAPAAPRAAPSLPDFPAPRQAPALREAPAPREAPMPRTAPRRSAIDLPRWGIHAERIARARRDAGVRQREALLPLVTGLIGGAAAGALIVAMIFAPRLTPVRRPNTLAARPSVASRAPEPVTTTNFAAVATPQNRPEVVTLRAPRSPAESVRPVRPAPPRAGSTAASRAPIPVAAVSTPAPAVSVPAPAATTPPVAARVDEADWPLFCGVVTDESGAPIVGARVLLADLEIRVHTDRRGRFCVAAPPGGRTLTVSAQGFAPYRRAVSVAAGVSELSLTLKPAP